MPRHNFDIIRFKFTTPLHVGNERSDYSTGSALLHSDGMYAAICHAWAKLGKAEWIPREENANSIFTLSSLFPYINYTDSTSYFLPRPLLLMDKPEENTELDTTVRKSLKKVQWVDVPVFESLALGNPIDHTKTYFDKGYQTVIELPRDEITKQLITPIANQAMPRASISRTGAEDTIIYYIDRYYFHERAGLYAFMQFDNEIAKGWVMAALRLLQEEGLGTDRNVGHGKFEFSIDTISINLPADAKYGINIGMYCPESKAEWVKVSQYEQVDARSGYSLVRRGGWMSEPRNTWRKRSVYMAQPGGVFKTDSRTILGKNVNVKPTGEGINTGHAVWRNGRSIFLPCKG